MPYKDPIVRKQKQAERTLKHRLNNPDYYKNYDKEHGYKYVDSRRLRHVKKKYNLEANDYLKMVEEQDNKCSICKKPETWTTKYGYARPLAVDHCHKTGKVRSLLCTRCNAVLGYIDDNADILEAAIMYLNKHKGE